MTVLLDVKLIQITNQTPTSYIYLKMLRINDKSSSIDLDWKGHDTAET